MAFEPIDGRYAGGSCGDFIRAEHTGHYTGLDRISETLSNELQYLGNPGRSLSSVLSS